MTARGLVALALWTVLARGPIVADTSRLADTVRKAGDYYLAGSSRRPSGRCPRGGSCPRLLVPSPGPSTAPERRAPLQSSTSSVGPSIAKLVASFARAGW